MRKVAGQRRGQGEQEDQRRHLREPRLLASRPVLGREHDGGNRDRDGEREQQEGHEHPAAAPAELDAPDDAAILDAQRVDLAVHDRLRVLFREELQRNGGARSAWSHRGYPGRNGQPWQPSLREPVAIAATLSRMLSDDEGAVNGTTITI